jgi:hypothetical protein
LKGNTALGQGFLSVPFVKMYFNTVLKSLFVAGFTIIEYEVGSEGRLDVAEQYAMDIKFRFF